MKRRLIHPVFLGVLALVLSLAPNCGGLVAQTNQTGQSGGLKKDNPIDGDAAYDFMKKVCELGPRISGSKAMAKQQAMLVEHFEKMGATVRRLEFKCWHPRIARRKVKLTNLWVSFHPDRKKRVLIATHYDTRPYANKDPDARKARKLGLFQGANDGASGVGLLAELGRHVKELDGTLGVDFIFFDAEEFVFDSNTDPLFVGSTNFAENYARDRSHLPFEYVEGILLDMIGDKTSRLVSWKRTA